MIRWNEVIQFASEGTPAPNRRVEKTEEEWNKLLTPEQFRITRLKGTERSHTGEYCKIDDEGRYNCICCNEPLFDSKIKYDSGTGWPSFSESIAENAVQYEMDKSLGMVRMEVLCNACDAHLGHVFKYGPKSGGLRYCINSESIKLEKGE